MDKNLLLGIFIIQICLLKTKDFPQLFGVCLHANHWVLQRHYWRWNASARTCMSARWWITKTPNFANNRNMYCTSHVTILVSSILLRLLKRQTIINPTNTVQLLLTCASLAMEEECKKKSMRKNCWVEWNCLRDFVLCNTTA